MCLTLSQIHLSCVCINASSKRQLQHLSFMNALWSYSGSRPTVGFQENERADRLAKTGNKQLQPTPTSTYQEAKTLLRDRQKCQWKRATGDYNPSTDPINRLARHEQTAIFRLRTGHCGLRAHLKRIGIMDSALCDCREAEQTIHHILQDCPIWRKQRHQLWPQDESTTNKLWGTAEDLRRTTQFLTTCGLRV